MDTLTSIRTWNDRQTAADNLDNQGRRRNSDRTGMADMGTPLRTIAAQQGAALRSVGSTGRKTPAQVEMEARVAAVRAEQNAPAPAARPAVASVGAPARPTFKQINDLSASIPTGFYALPKRPDATNANQPTYHFKIHKFRGGHRIVMVTGGVGHFVEIPMKTAWQWVALQKIAADPKAAAVLFGQETGTCGRCGSPLTNATSRAYGLGPDCRKAY
jgi:hypothetical protein